MNIDEILNLVDDLLEKAWSVPLSGGKCMVDVEQLSALIDDIRLNMPMEIKHAKAIVADRGEIVAGAKVEAAEMIKKAESRAQMLIAENEITKQAKRKSDEMVNAATIQSKQIRKAAAEYVERIVGTTEKTLTQSLGEMREVRKEFSRKNTI